MATNAARLGLSADETAHEELIGNAQATRSVPRANRAVARRVINAIVRHGRSTSWVRLMVALLTQRGNFSSLECWSVTHIGPIESNETDENL